MLYISDYEKRKVRDVIELKIKISDNFLFLWMFGLVCVIFLKIGIYKKKFKM